MSEAVASLGDKPQNNRRISCGKSQSCVTITLHSGGELGLSVAAYLHFAVSVPNLTLAIDMQYPNLASDIIAERHPFAAGWMTPPLGSGLGVTPDEAALRTTEIPNPYLDPTRPDWFPTKPAY